MKKFLLSFFFLAAFAAYSVGARSRDSAPPVVAENKITGSSSEAAMTIPKKVAVAPRPAPALKKASSAYKDGEYTGSVADAYYGNVQVKAVISGGKIADVQFLDHPNDRRTSVEINNYAMPILKSEAVSSQSAQVDVVSGASDTSEAFKESLASALSIAKNT